MRDAPTAMLDRIDDEPTMVLYSLDDTVQLWAHLLDELPLWPARDPDPPLTVGDPRQRPRPVAPSCRWSTSTTTLERLLDGLRHL